MEKTLREIVRRGGRVIKKYTSKGRSREKF
jgi:hypothetical protein